MAFMNGYWRVKDLNSSNGVKVNGQRVDEKFVQPGDSVAFGKHRFEIEYTPDPDAAPMEEPDPFAMSLLEKAGLRDDNARPRRPAPDAAKKPPQADASKQPPDEKDDDDRALEWMAE
jgi:adenylate cyclase